MPVHLTIVTPARVAYEGDAAEVQVPGWEGEYGVLPNHAQMLTLTRPGVVTVLGGANPGRMLVGKGLAEVGPDRVTLLVDRCEDPAKIDKAAARAELDAAQRLLLTAAPGTAEHAVAQGRADLAQARLEA